MATKLSGKVTYLHGLLPIKSLDPLITWPCEIAWQTKNYYQNVYGHPTWRMLFYLDGILSIESHYLLITWSCKIKWKSKIIRSPLPQCLQPSNLASWWLAMRDFYSCYSISWSCGYATPGNKLNFLYLHYHSTYGLKIW